MRSAVLLGVAIPVLLSGPVFGGLPEPVLLKTSADITGTVMFLGQVRADGAANRSEMMAHELGNGLVGLPAVFAHFERLYASECADRCKDGKSILAFLAVPDGERGWVFPENTTVSVERDNGSVFVAEDVFRVAYKFREPWLEPEFRAIGLDSSALMRPNDVGTDMESQDLARFDGAFYSPTIVGDNTLFAFFALIPSTAAGGQPWPYRNRDSFTLSLVSRGGLP